MHTLTNEMLCEMWDIDNGNGNGGNGDNGGNDIDIDIEDKLSKMKLKSADEDPPEFNKMSGDDMIEWTTRAVLDGVLQNVKHGDTIRWLSPTSGCPHHGNNGLMFWSDSDGAMHPYTGIDDYGSVPPCFRVGEHGFRPDHWTNTVAHNKIVFLSDDLVESLEKQRQENRSCLYIDIYGVSYTVHFDPSGPVGNAFHSCILNILISV